MMEAVAAPTAHTITRIQAEATASHGWLVIEAADRRLFLLAGDTIKCHDNGVEFIDDDGEYVLLAYGQILLLGSATIEAACEAIEKEAAIVTARQLKAARALLGWSQRDLSEKSGVSLPTIASLEQDEGELGGREATRKKLFAAFDRAGLTFLNAAELGVILRPKGRR